MTVPGVVGPTFWILAVVLIVYSFLRLILTLVVGPQREEEERSGYTPAFGRMWRPSWSTYGWMVWPHHVVTFLMFVAIGTFVYHTWGWLMLDVFIPAFR